MANRELQSSLDQLTNSRVNKAELVKELAAQCAFTQKEVEQIIDLFLQTIQTKLSQGVSVRLVGFGTFERRIRKGRAGHNPRHIEEKVYIPSHYVPCFKAGKNLQGAVRKSIR